MQCTLPSGKVVLIEDLPIEKLEEITVGAGLEPRDWFAVAYSPAVYPCAAVALLKVCAAHVGDPEPPAGYITVGNVLKVFTKVEDDLPTSYTDGMPDPKADGQETEQSSGVPDSSVGPRMSSVA